MSNVINVILFLAIPLFPWLILGYILGVKEYFPSSIWIYISEFASFYLIPFGLIIYKKYKNRNRAWATFAMAASLVLMIPSVIFVGKDISGRMINNKTLAKWENSIFTACQSFNRDNSPLNFNIRFKDQVWKMINGHIDDSDRDQLLRDKPEEWNNAVKLIAMIDEQYQETGSIYVVENSNSPTGIKAVQYTWSVFICDLENKQIILENRFVGPMPPAKLTVTDTAGYKIYGVKPIAEYQTWIDGLTDK